MVFGGTRDRDDLTFWSTLTGERDERVLTTDLHGRVASRTVRRVPVLAPAQIANLPTGKVLLIRRGLAPIVGRVTPAWRRRDVRAHQRALARATGAAVPELEGPVVEQLDRLPVQTGSATDGAGDRWEIPADWFTDPNPDPGAGPEQAGGPRPEGWN
jgi:hypothetical protein